MELYHTSQHRARRIWRSIRRAVLSKSLFPTDLIIHFGSHKCLTNYYDQIMTQLADEFGMLWKPFYSNYAGFLPVARDGRGKRVLGLDDWSDVEWEVLPDFRGSHFVRDPRDLIVSGYYYHLWTDEPWCVRTPYYWYHVVQNPYFQYVESDPARYPREQSYQAYLKSLDEERGLILELVWRAHLFDRVRRWNFNNPRIIECKYEEIVGNEVAAFTKIFQHYGFHPRLARRGLELVEQHSLKNRAKGEQSHVRKGTQGQWAQDFTPLVKSLFKQTQGDLLIQLGYERDLDW